MNWVLRNTWVILDKWVAVRHGHVLLERRVCCRVTRLSIISDRANRLVGWAEPGARIRFDNRIELLRMSSAGVHNTPVDVFSTVFIIRCTMGNCSLDYLSCTRASKSTRSTKPFSSFEYAVAKEC